MEIALEAQPFDLDFHPSSSIVAAALINGNLQLFKYEDVSESEVEPACLWSVTAHTESCRAVRFAHEGQYVLTASPDCSILATNVETGQVIARLTNSHGAAINRLINLTENTVASGDDEGTIKVWDTRQNSCCNTFDVHEDYVADMEYVPQSNHLLGASGDGTLSVCNLRRNKVETCSEFAEDELLSVVLVKNGRKVICGTQDGMLLLYSWGHFKDCSDRFVGHPKSVDTLLKLDEDTLITGSSDGLIRILTFEARWKKGQNVTWNEHYVPGIVTILPNKMIGVVGEHAEFPVEQLAFSPDQKILGSVSHDNTLKLWDISYLKEDGTTDAEELPIKEENEMDVDNSDDDSDGDLRGQGSKRKKRKGSGSSSHQIKSTNFFRDLL